jgi:hypothetical protein
MLVRHGLEHLDWVLQRRQSFAREVVWAEQTPGAKLLKMSVLGNARSQLYSTRIERE